MKKVLVPALQLLGALAFTGLLIALAISRVEMRLFPVFFWGAAIFGPIGYETRFLWRRPAYWVVFCLALLAHTVFLMWLQAGRGPLRAVDYLLVAIIESAALLFLLLAVGQWGRRRS